MSSQKTTTRGYVPLTGFSGGSKPPTVTTTLVKTGGSEPAHWSRRPDAYVPGAPTQTRFECAWALAVKRDRERAQAFWFCFFALLAGFTLTSGEAKTRTKAVRRSFTEQCQELR